MKFPILLALAALTSLTLAKEQDKPKIDGINTPQCTNGDDHFFPTRETHEAAARKFCHEVLAPDDYMRVNFGYVRRFYNVQIYKKYLEDANQTRDYAFEIRMDRTTAGNQYPHIIDLRQCIEGLITPTEDSVKEQWNACWILNGQGGRSEIVRDWRAKIHKKGWADVQLRAYPSWKNLGDKKGGIA